MSKERRLGRGLAALLGDRDEEQRSNSTEHASTMTQELPTPVAGYTEEREFSSGTLRSGGANFPQPPAPIPSRPVPPATPIQPAKTPTLDELQDLDSASGQLLMLAVHEIDDNPFQPRREFSESEIVSLAESLKEHDMLQPISVRRVADRWQLISGERRLRAAVRAGWRQVPALVRQADDRLVAELAIIENLHRKDLNPIEKALSFRRYLDEHKCTQDDLARRLKIDRSTIANLMRLLELPEGIQLDLQRGTITAGHARALLPLGDEGLQLRYAKQIVDEGMNVREVEQLVSDLLRNEDQPNGQPTRRPGRPPRNPQLTSLEQRLRIALGTKVDIKPGANNRGQLVIHFKGNDEFERLVEVLLAGTGQEARSFAG